MLMLWSDLSVGDKIKFTKTCVDYYLDNSYDWANSVKDKIFNVSGISTVYNSTGLRICLSEYRNGYVDIYVYSGVGIGWSFKGQLIEIVELGSN